MQGLAFKGSIRRHASMPLTIPTHKAEQRLLGQALRAIRESKRPKPSLRNIGQVLDMTGANYQQYEIGERAFTPERLAEILQALDATEDELEAEKARLLGVPTAASDNRVAPEEMVFEVHSRTHGGAWGGADRDVSEPLRRLDLRQALGPNVGAMEVAGESMIPWAEPGEIVLFDRSRHPRRGYGCVMESKSGEYSVKFYSHMDGSTLFVRELYPQERTVQVPLSDLKGVYAVRMRGD